MRNVFAKEFAHNRELVFFEEERDDFQDYIEEIKNDRQMSLLDKENPLRPPSPKAKSLAWTKTNASTDASFYFSGRTFRMRPLFSNSENISVNGDFEWVHSLLSNSMNPVFHGDVKTSSNRQNPNELFMSGVAGGFALSRNFEAGDVRNGGGKIIVAEDASVKAADETSHFLVSGEHNITNIGRDAKLADNITEFRGEWEDLEAFFSQKLSKEDRHILGVTGFDQQTYDSIKELRKELMERKKNWSGNTHQNIKYIYSDPDIISSIPSGTEMDAKLNNIEELAIDYNSNHTENSFSSDTVEKWLSPQKSLGILAYASERKNDLTGDEAEVIEQATDEILEMRFSLDDDFGFEHYDLESILCSLEEIMDAQALLTSQTLEQDLESGSISTHYQQADELSDPEFDILGDNEIGFQSRTRCRLCGRYVENVAKYFRAIERIERYADKKGISSEALNKGFDLEYEFEAV